MLRRFDTAYFVFNVILDYRAQIQRPLLSIREMGVEGLMAERDLTRSDGRVWAWFYSSMLTEAGHELCITLTSTGNKQFLKG